MFDFNAFKENMVDLYDDEWIESFKKNPIKIMTKYYSNNGNGAVYEEYYKTFISDMLNYIDVKIDPISAKPAFTYASKLYTTDKEILKLATLINEKTGLVVDHIRLALNEMIIDKKNSIASEKQANMNPTFDQSVFSDALRDILEHEEYVLDFELMNYKKVVGTDNNGNNIYTTITHDILMSTVTANENARAINLNVKPLTRELLNYIKYYNDTLKQKALAEIIDKTKYDPKSGDFFDKFAKYVHEVYNTTEPLDVFTVALKQMYWCIKRLTRELSTHNDLTLTLRGAQGIGKSFLVDAMFGTVLGKFYNPSAKISDIIDDRWTPALGNMLLVNIDESDVGSGASYMSDKGMSPLKSRITNTVFSYRPLGTNIVVEVRKKATFISTSNDHIYEIMNDSSGMRRFLEFNSRNEKQQRFDSDKVAKIKENAFKAFQSIDENLEKGYWDVESEVGKKITAIQDTYVTKPAINEFAESLEVDREMKYNDCMGMDTLYDHYESYCSDQKINDKYRITKKNFRRKLEDLIDGCTKVHGNIYRFCVKFKEHELDIKDVTRSSFLERFKA